MMLPAIILSAFSEAASPHRDGDAASYSPSEVDNAWIRVPWSHGGYYYHNTLTREDQSHPPNCLSGDCPWKERS